MACLSLADHPSDQCVHASEVPGGVPGPVSVGVTLIFGHKKQKKDPFSAFSTQQCFLPLKQHVLYIEPSTASVSGTW